MDADTRRNVLEVARAVTGDEAAALSKLSAGLGAAFVDAVDTLLGASQVIVSGIGKSGNIGGKIAASLTSTGTPAVFLHPVEALHGDLGIVTSRHCLIALSRSGNTEEMLRFVAHFRRLGGPVISMTQKRESRLAELSQHALILPDEPEAGPLNLAPTTSCIMMLAMGDALAMALLSARGFASEDFAQYHPEGSLGRRLLLRAEDLMHAAEALPRVEAGATFEHLLVEMTRKGLGLAVVVDSDGGFVGTFTDGDLRRVFQRVDNPRSLDAMQAFQRSRRAPNAAPAVSVSTIEPSRLAVDCLQIMREEQITCLVVLDAQRRPVGVVRLMDLIQAGLG